MKKITKTILAVCVMTMLMSVVVYAKTFYYKDVYGAYYSVVAEGECDNDGNYLTVTVVNIYKEDGSNSSYTKVKADILDAMSSQLSYKTDTVLEKGKAGNIMLVQSMPSGTYMALRMKGNNSNLNCIVDFSAALQ